MTPASAPQVDRPSDRSVTPEAIAFIVIAANSAAHTGPLLDLLRQASRKSDEIILLVRTDRLNHAPRDGRPWLRVVDVATTDLFTLRSHIPSVSRKPWLFI